MGMGRTSPRVDANSGEKQNTGSVCGRLSAHDCVSGYSASQSRAGEYTAGSASIKGETLFVTLTNSHVHETVDLTVDLLGEIRAVGASGQILTGEIHALNTFASPTQVAPQAFDVRCEPSRLSLALPPASVAAIQVHLS